MRVLDVSVKIEQLIELQLPVLRTSLCRTMDKSLQDRLPVDDVVHETYVKAMEASSTFEYRGEASLRSWLFKIAQNVIRTKIRRKSPQLVEVAETLIESGVLRPSEIMSKREQCESLGAALEGLPVHYQVLLRMRYIEGCSFEEIASSQCTTAAGARGQHRSAIQSLRRLFQISTDSQWVRHVSRNT